IEVACVADELVVGAGLSDATVHENGDAIGAAHGVIAVGGEDDDLLFAKLGEQTEDLALADGIETGAWLVQHKQWGIVVEQTADGEALPLPTGEVSGAAEAGSDDGVESVRQAAYCFLHSGNSQRRKDLLI